MDDASIKHMVDRFLQWKLPKTFSPDNGISFNPVCNPDTDHTYTREPMGTNLLDAIQAAEMVRFIVEGLPTPMQDDLAALVGEARNAAYLAKKTGDWRYFNTLELAATTLETQAREIAELRLQDDGWERVGFLEEKLRQAEASIESLNSHLPKYLTALAERDANLRVAREALEDIADPIQAMQRYAESQCAQLSGMAYQIANDPDSLSAPPAKPSPRSHRRQPMQDDICKTCGGTKAVWDGCAGETLCPTCSCTM